MKKDKTDAATAPKEKSRLARTGYAASLSVIVIALAVAVNLIVGQLPSTVREVDISPSGLYTVSDTSVEYLSKLDADVKLVVLAEDNTLDARIDKFLSKYAALSSHLTVTKIDPVKNPSALSTYDAASNSIVVINSATGKQRVVSLSDIITYDYSNYYYTGQATEDSFDAEGQLTSAIEYVTGESTEKVYLLAGHGETTFPTGAAKLVDKANISSDSLNLLLSGAVPQDCSLIICYAPASDLADDELALLKSYLAAGGQVMLFEGQDDPDLPNWHTLLSEYGIAPVSGYIADTQRYYAQSQSYYAVFPVFASSELTSGFGSNDLALVTNSHGYTEGTPARDTISVSPIMTTSDCGMAVTQDAQTQGTYWLGAVATEDTDNGTARLTVFGSSTLIDDSLTGQFSNLANLTLFTNALTAGFDSVSSVSIPAKSLSYTYNTIPAGGMWGALFAIVLPILLIVGGLVVWAKRRKR